MNPVDPFIHAHAADHATKFLIDWLCRAENQSIRDQIRAYSGAVPEPGTAIRMAILGMLAPLPVPPGDKMEFLVEAIQTMFAIVDWVAVADQVLAVP